MRRTALLIFVASAACSSFSSAGGEPGPDPGDAGDGGADGTATGDAATSTCPFVFVSQTTGDDARTGCDGATAVKSLAVAVARAKANGSTEIRACAGAYDEQALVLDAPISLRGGWDCTTWARSDTARTLITRRGTSIDQTTLRVVGATIGRATEIEGISVEGPESGSHGIAVAVAGGASPTIHHVNVVGGATASANGTGSTGIDIREGSRPEIRDSKVSGGLGTANVTKAAERGAVAIHIGASSPSLHDLEIDAGAALTSVAGILVTGDSVLTGENALHHLKIRWSAADFRGDGILVSGAGAGEVEIRDNLIDLGALSCSPTPIGCEGHDIFVSGQKRATIARNRLVTPEIPSGTSASATMGVALADSAEAIVQNNMIAAGSFKSGAPPIGAMGINVVGAKGTIIRGNTVFISPVGKSSFAVFLRKDTPGTIVEGNLLGSFTGDSHGVFYHRCGGSSLASLRGNAFVGLKFVGRVLPESATCDSATSKFFSKLTEVDTPDKMSQNVQATLGCSDAECLPLCTATPTDCATNVIAGLSSLPRDSLLTPAGWKLRSDVACKLAQLFQPAPAFDADDHFALPRVAPFSPGAHESDTCIP